MVTLSRIYTRTGDDGTTGLATGPRRPKHDLRVAAYGTVDEVTAVIGVARLHTEGVGAIDAMLARIQNDLFDLAADLCSPELGKGPGGERLAVNAAQVKRLEDEIDLLNADLAPLRTFVLAGGTPAAAYLHLARTVCRRAERLIVGNGLDAATQMGPSINQGQLETVMEYVRIGQSEGARLVCGGRRLNEGALGHGYFHQPTIFTDVKRDMRIAQEEIFGPVLSIIPVGSRTMFALKIIGLIIVTNLIGVGLYLTSKRRRNVAAMTAS